MHENINNYQAQFLDSSTGLSNDETGMALLNQHSYITVL